MQNMEMQIKQIAGEVNVLKAQRDNKLPSQGKGPEVKPILAISLRSGKEVKSPEEEEEIIVKKKSEEKDKGKQRVDESVIVSVDKEKATVKEKEKEERSYVPKAPFPSRLAMNKQAEAERDMLEIFKKVEVNIPIVYAIERCPKVAKFLKNLCTNKRKLRGNEVVNLYSVLSLDARLPRKEKDPGIFAIPCTIGHQQSQDARST